jgi:hypothetical protein
MATQNSSNDHTNYYTHESGRNIKIIIFNTNIVHFTENNRYQTAQ